MNTALCVELDSNPQTTSSWFSMNAKYVDFQFQIPENWIKVCLFLSYCNGFNVLIISICNSKLTQIYFQAQS